MDEEQIDPAAVPPQAAEPEAEQPQQPQAEDERRYWCDEPPLEFSRLFFARCNTPIEGPMLGYGENIMRAHRTYYGSQPLGEFYGGGPSSAFVGRDGEQGEIVTVKVNKARSYANARHNLVTNPELTWNATAVNTDSRSMSDASRGKHILEYLWKEKGYGRQAIDAVLGAYLYGEEFLLCLWDDRAGDQVGFDGEDVHYKGDLVCHNVSSWDVMRDQTASSFDESPWLCARVSVSRWDLVAHYPDFRTEILDAASVGVDGWGSLLGAIPQGARDDDRVSCYYFFHRKTSALPSGLQAVMLGPDLVLEHRELERCNEILPIHRMAAGDLRGTPYADTDFWETMAIQELLDDANTSAATNMVTFGKLMLSHEGPEGPITQWGDGPKMIPRNVGTQAPEFIVPPSTPPSTPAQVATWDGDMQQLSGLNDMAMGQPDSAAMNAQYGALMVAMSVQQNSDLQKRYVRLVSQLGRSMLRIFREKASEPRKVKIVGVHGPQTVGQFSGKDLEALDDVYVEIGNPLLQSAAGRQDLAKLYIEQGWVLSPEQLQQVWDTGRLDPLTQGRRAELIYIAEENEQILGGINPPVKITDSHQEHMREHTGPGFSAAARADPAVNRAMDAHMLEHIGYLRDPANAWLWPVLGQAAPPPPPAPDPSTQKGVATAMQSPMQGQPQAGDVKIPKPPMDPMTGGPLVPDKGGQRN